MQLSIEDVDQFFRLHRSLMFFVNDRLRVIDGEVASVEVYSALTPQVRFQVHEALLEHMDLIDAFADVNPFHFDEANIEIVRSWKHLVTGEFFAYRPLRNHMVFLTSTDPAVAYGVLALFSPFEDLIPPPLPRMIKTTLLPFKGQIVYDGLMTARNVTFGPGIRRSLDESYKEAKASGGIVTSLPPPRVIPGVIATKAAPKKRAGGKPKGGPGASDAAKAAHDRIVALTDDFCRDHLDDEYGEMCRKMAGVLARKRPSPLARGKAESWASGIVRVVGGENFLGDPSQPHHMKMSDVSRILGVSDATGSAKATEIRKLLKIRPFEAEWTLPSRMEQNPMIWMIQVNGLIVDARQLPRPIQEEAFRKGLIPYIPADRAGK